MSATTQFQTHSHCANKQYKSILLFVASNVSFKAALALAHIGNIGCGLVVFTCGWRVNGTGPNNSIGTAQSFRYDKGGGDGGDNDGDVGD